MQDVRMEARKTIGRYQVKRWLAAGSMGEIYEAHDPVIDRPVTIKTVRRELIERGDADVWLARFQHEMRAAGRLAHPNVVMVHDCGEAAGTPYLVMEYVEGESLDRVLQQSGRLGLDEAISIISQTLAALEFAHARGVIHRDVKPSNILRTKDGAIKITDFGVAHIAESNLTSTGVVLGTLSYMAPEQLTGARVDQRADIFAAGVVLFELLGGAKPFEGGTLGMRLLAMEQRGPPDIRSLNAEVPPALQRALATALAFDPESRYATAAAFSRAIADAVAKPAAAAAPAWSEDATVAAAPAASPLDRQRHDLAIRTAAPQPHRPMRTQPSDAPPSGVPLSAPAARRGWPALTIGLGAMVIVAVAALVLAMSGVFDRRIEDRQASTPPAAAPAAPAPETPPPSPAAPPPAPSRVPAPEPAPAPAAVPTPASAPPAQALPKPGDSFRDCPDCPEMVWLPAGSFVMGTEPAETTREGVPDSIAKWERPRHPVNVRSIFAIGRYHVTRGEYGRFAAAGGRSSEGGCHIGTGSKVELDSRKSWRDPGFPQSDNDPVVCVSWQDAKAYAAWLSQTTGKSYRLPTEAEWEYAARARTTTARYWGDVVGAGNANCDGCGSKWDNRSSSPVGSFPANAFDLYDMLGNAWQWTEDCWNASYANAPSDSSISLAAGDCGLRVLRGGSWSRLPRIVRAGFRGRSDAAGRDSDFGFRVARTQ
jgi:formylglycine-generating enzyme required for sulfatase activity/tRNA A-37 threonylcarbamoyl transferase component Bud32